MSKSTLTLLLIAVVVSSFAAAETAQLAIAQTKPSIPEFTLRYVDNSYDVAPSTTSSTDPYTGRITNSTVAGYRVENRSVQVMITNQPFASCEEDGDRIELYYQVFFKGHFAKNWFSVEQHLGRYNVYDSSASITVISAPVYNVSDGGQIDFQVRALVGKFERVYGTPVPPFGTPYNDVFIGEASDWSSTQTITIPDTSPTPTPTSTNTPMPTESSSLEPTLTPTATVPEFPAWIVLPLLFATVVLLVIVRRRKLVCSKPFFCQNKVFFG